MLRVGRSLLLVLGFLSLQLSLLSGGEKCLVSGVFVAESNSAMAGMDMAGMDMAGMDMAGMDMTGMDMTGMDMTGMDMTGTEITSHEAGAHSDASSPHDDEHACDDDGASTSCNSMTVCVFAAVTAPGSVRIPQGLPSVRAPALALRTPPTTRDAPELPPPRLQS